ASQGLPLIVHDSRIHDNTGAGIIATEGLPFVVRHTQISNNTGDGIQIGGQATLDHVTLTNNPLVIDATASGVVLDHVTVDRDNGSGAALTDNGTATIYRSVSVHATGMNATSAIKAGPNAFFDIFADFANSQFSSAAVDLSAV